MGWRSMFSILRRNSLVPLLLWVQVALACAILSNVVFLAAQKLEPMLAPSGMSTRHLILASQIHSQGRAWTQGEVRGATRMLREVPGVKAVSVAMGVPLTQDIIFDLALEGSTGAKVGVNAYAGKGLVDTLGLKLVAGRDFRPSEYRATGIGGNFKTAKQPVRPIIITQALADALFGGKAVGKLAHNPEVRVHQDYRVVGVVRHLLRNQLNLANDGRSDDSVLLPDYVKSSTLLDFAIRVAPGTPSGVLKQIRKVIHDQFGPLMGPDAKAVVNFYDVLRARAFESQRDALWMFAGIALTVLIVTLVGIIGLTGFWVQKRTRQIGIRRALGARRGDILRYFMAENAMIVGAGAVFGMLLAYVGNHMLMQYYELHALPKSFLPTGAIAMLVLGQLAALGPALRASRVPPVVATRSV